MLVANISEQELIQSIQQLLGLAVVFMRLALRPRPERALDHRRPHTSRYLAKEAYQIVVLARIQPEFDLHHVR